MRASASSSPLRETGQGSSARHGIAQAIATILMAASVGTLAQAADAIEGPVDSDEATQTQISDAASSQRLQPAQSLIGRVDLANATTTSQYVPTFSLERSRLLPSSRDWPGGSGVDAFGRPYTEMGGLSYRWWLRRGRADIGVGVGTVGYLVSPIEGLGASPHSPGPHSHVYAGPHTLVHTAPTVTVGWRYQVDDRSMVFADALQARRSYADDRSEVYSTKVGMEWKERKSRVGFEQGKLGIQFDSGLRMSLRARKGGLGLYLRSQF